MVEDLKLADKHALLHFWIIFAPICVLTQYTPGAHQPYKEEGKTFAIKVMYS